VDIDDVDDDVTIYSTATADNDTIMNGRSE